MIIIMVFKTLLNCKKLLRAILFSGFLIWSCTLSVNAQILRDSASVELVKKGIDYIYNFDFQNAEKINSELRNLFPGQPITFLYKGMMSYWENYPLTPASGASSSFVADMRKSIDLCDKDKNKENEAEILLLNLCARGLLLLYYTENDMSFEVFPIASSTYQCIRRSFGFTSSYKDLYFFTGIYNYYREAYPEAHPVYKTLAFLFPKGSKETGIADLQRVAKSSILMKAEAYTFLNDIYLSFENDYEKAVFFSSSLHDLYPNNPEFHGTYIKNLLLVKKYDEAEKEIIAASGIRNAFFQAQLAIFNGILQEKRYKNPEKAEELYTKGIRNIAPFRDFGYEYAAYGYFGLSRIAGLKGKTDDQKNYRKLAMKIADFKKINFD
jgi:hypothetical protein